MSKRIIEFRADGKSFSLTWSDAKSRPVVHCIDPDWSYEDEDFASDMTAEVKLCRSLDDAAYMLGVW